MGDFLEEAKRRTLYGAPPDGPVLDGPPETASSAEDLFSAEDLLAAVCRPETYTMPGGKRLWVHGWSVAELIYIQEKAAAEVRALQLESEADAQAQAAIRGQVWQAITVCRKGPELDAARVFGAEHAEKLRRNPGWGRAIREIAALSDQVAGGKTETDLLREGLAGFFDGLRSRQQTCSSLLNPGESDSSPSTPEALSAALEECGSYVSQWRRRVGV